MFFSFNIYLYSNLCVKKKVFNIKINLKKYKFEIREIK